MPSADIPIANPWGMHARLAYQLSMLCRTFPCSVAISYGGQRADAKEMTGILLLAAGPSATVTVETEGEGADKALEELRNWLLVDAKVL